MDKYDVIIIGTGTAGQSAALELAAEGYSVAIVESSSSPGGVCALRGCQAKKYFYEVTETVARALHLLGKGVSEPPQINWQQIHEEKNKFTANIPENTVNNMRGNGVAFHQGEARFMDGSTISVDRSTLQADYIVIATGALPRQLDIDGGEHTITSNEFLELKELPRRIAFIGGGFISFEFAHFAARLGGSPGNIHILEVHNRPLQPFDEDMVLKLMKASEDEGINIQTAVTISSIAKNNSTYTITMDNGNTIEVDLVVNSIGREPNIKKLNLEAADVECSANGIRVNSNMQSTNPAIYAVGDCAETLQLARVADMEALTAAGSIVAQMEGSDPPSIDYTAAPAVLFTYPQLGMVGKTEKQLQTENIKYWKSFEANLSWPTYRRVGMKHAAFKILVDADDCILGAHFLSDNATGLVNTFKEAMLNKTSVVELHRSNIMAPYPSRESDILYMLAPFVE